MLAVSRTADPDIRERATITREGEINVVLINDSLTDGHVVHVRPPGPAGAATLERLRAASAAATDGATLAGQTFGNDTGTGRLEGTLRTVRLRLRHGSYLVRMPASSAAMLTFTPAPASPPTSRR